MGGDTVKMNILRGIFEKTGFAGVEIFITSGNVIFETERKNPIILATEPGKQLEQYLSCKVDTGSIS